MKLLLISVKSDSPAGGIATWTEQFMNCCSEREIDCHLVNTEIIGKRKTTGKRRFFDELLRTIHIFRDLTMQLKTYDFDAVYLNTACGNYGLFRDAFIARIVCKKSLSLITHYHCEIPFWVKCKASIYTLGKLARMSRSNLVLCQNSYNFLQKHYGVVSHKVPNFVNSAIVRITPKPISGPVQRVVFVGSVTEDKGAIELFNIAQNLPHIQFVLVGQTNNTIFSWKKPPNLKLTGLLPPSQVIHHLDNADVFLFPSHTEGCSMALMEAMARGLPAIATNTGANAEMLADGCGIVVDCHDVDAMIKAIHRLDDPFIRTEMAKKSISRIQQKYTEKNVEILLDIIEDKKEEET